MYKILSIDGGGIKGVFPASFLATVESNIEDKIYNYFDLIVGTSTGGIIALALGLGLSAEEILAFYRKLGKSVFKDHNILKSIRHLAFSKYDRNELEGALSETFGERKLGDCSKRLVIPSVNLESGNAYVFKTSHHERLTRDDEERVVDIALATAAAPTYFPAHRSRTGLPLIDGGMWANNPVNVAVIEALGVLGWPAESLRVLSIGCTTQPLKIGLGRRLPLGLLYWAKKSINVFMTAQSSASLAMAQFLIGKNNIYRYSPIVANGRFSLDGIKEIDSLRGLGDKEARQALGELRPIFFDKHSPTFKPFNNPVDNS